MDLFKFSDDSSKFSLEADRLFYRFTMEKKGNYLSENGKLSTLLTRDELQTIARNIRIFLKGEK